MLIFLVLASFGTVYCSPHGQYLLLNNQAQQSYPQYVDGQNVALFNHPNQAQDIPYVPQNNLIYLQNGPEQLSYVNPSPFYAWVQKDRGFQPPQSVQPTQTIEPTPAPKEDKPDSAEPESLQSNEPTTAKPDSEADKSENEPAKLENFEPDAELIPETVNSQASQPVQPQTPVVPFPGNQGIIPGQRVYFINGPPQFYSNDPLIGYPQLNTQLRPQPALRYPGFPQRFLILGQQSAVQQPTYQQQGQSIDFLRSQFDQSRIAHAQRLQVPSLISFQRQVAPNQQDETLPQRPEFDGQSRTQEQEFDQQQEVAVPQQFVTNDNQYIANNYGFPANLQQQLNYGVLPTNNIQNQPGVAALAFSRFLQDSRDSIPATQKKDEIIDDEDSVVVEADENKTEEKLEVENDKIELNHEDLKSDPVVAEVHPQAVAVAGNGGVARSAPKGTAVAGPEGLAIANPVATALAGVPEKKVKAPVKA